MLEYQHLISGYQQALLNRPFSCQLPSSGLVVLLGRNGCGKTTLLHTTVGFIAPLQGRILVDKHPLTSLSIKKRAQMMSIVGTDAVQSPYMCVYDLIALGRYPYLRFMGRLQDKDRSMIDRIMRLLDIEHLQHKQVNACSDGERQLVQLARALAQDTPVILLDEATAHLDFVNKVKIFECLRDLSQTQQKLILMSSHDLQIALEYADQVLLFEKGELTYDTPANLQQQGLISRVFEAANLRFRL
jgi:iron complex transport system ATP-binding protein